MLSHRCIGQLHMYTLSGDFRVTSGRGSDTCYWPTSNGTKVSTIVLT